MVWLLLLLIVGWMQWSKAEGTELWLLRTDNTKNFWNCPGYSVTWRYWRAACQSAPFLPYSLQLFPFLLALSVLSLYSLAAHFWGIDHRSWMAITLHANYWETKNVIVHMTLQGQSLPLLLLCTCVRLCSTETVLCIPLISRVKPCFVLFIISSLFFSTLLIGTAL